MLDTKALAAATAAIVREEIERATGPLMDRIAELEARQPEKGEKGEPGERGADGKDGRDGVGLAGALIDRKGALIVTLTDGTTRELGPVVGADGKDGRDGIDGSQGEPGADGVGFDDLEVEYDGQRKIGLTFTKGETVKRWQIEMPVVIDCGVYKAGEEYRAGDGVTWAGSYWIAQKDTNAKPDGGEDWRLAVKRGRDGKDAK